MQGEFLDDERHGLGIIQCPGLAFIGSWAYGKRHGVGVCVCVCVWVWMCVCVGVCV